MYANARHVAEAVLRLLERLPIDEKVDFDIEMAAAILAVHVCDWHLKTDKSGGKDAADKEAFGRTYPAWEVLREIANGTKHPHAKLSSGDKKYPDISSAKPAEIEWENPDLWHAPQKRKTLFIGVKGKERSVYSLTYGFCRQFLAATAAPNEREPWMDAYRRRKPAT